jgi:hypothetical protein
MEERRNILGRPESSPALIDPYRLLQKLFSDEFDRDYEIVFEQDRISDGGAAMTAYGKLQFQEMSPQERMSIESALLKYCELDTLAMVMIYEAWKAELYGMAN